MSVGEVAECPVSADKGRRSSVSCTVVDTVCWTHNSELGQKIVLAVGLLLLRFVFLH